jgi:hypothetical protein
MLDSRLVCQKKRAWVEGCALHFGRNDAVDAFECSIRFLQSTLPDRYVQILEARPIVCVLRRLSDVDGVRKVVLHNVEAVQVAKVNQVRFFKYSRRGSRGRVGAPRRSVSQML